MISSTNCTRRRTDVTIAMAFCFAVGIGACDSDDDAPDPTLVDELQSDADVPFDADVPGAGDDTETDERTNQGFDLDEPGPVGNQTNPNE